MKDVLFTTLAYIVAIDVVYYLGQISADESVVLLKLIPVPLLLAIFATLRVAPQLKIRNETLTSQVWFCLRHVFVVVGGMLLFVYLSGVQAVSEQMVLAFALLLGGGLLVDRIFLKWWYLTSRRETKSNFLKVLVIGTGSRAQRLITKYRNASEWGVDIVGALDPDPSLIGREVAGVQVVGDLARIREVLSNQVIDEVVVCVPRSLIDGIQGVADACRQEGVSLKLLADLFDFDHGRISLDRVDELPVISFEPVVHDETALLVKRLFDLFVTIAALVLLAPLFLLVAIAIKLDSRGPVFFRQQRVGLHKRRFWMYKFRSMHEDAEARLKEIEHLNEADGPIFKMARDPRVTRVGRFIRRTSIDELPQLFNVFLGDMGLVGPRPMSIRDVERFDSAIQRRRFSFRPGLVCLREVSGRSRLSFDRWLELDLQYIERWSLWLDLKILVRAFGTVLRGDGAV
ncbi:MAG: sugar transferase [Pseudomonadales bacterium]